MSSRPVSNGRRACSVPSVNPRYTPFKLVVRRSKIHRWGLYTEEFIPKGRKVIEYTGEKISRRETKRRAEQSGEVYLFQLNSYWCLDGAVGGSGAEYANHSCNPNLRAVIIKGHILYMAARDIQPGEELTVDYHFDPDVERHICRCGAPNCRGTINRPK